MELFLNMVGLKWSMPGCTCELLKCWSIIGKNFYHRNWVANHSVLYMVDSLEGVKHQVF